MESYLELKERQQKEVNEFPFGFAFSRVQFGKMMKKWGLHYERDIDKIVSIGSGGYVQKKDQDDMHKMFSRHKKEIRDAISADESGEGFVCEMFLQEMRNHEYGWTGDPEETLDSLGMTWEQVQNNEKLLKGFNKASEIALGNGELV